MGCASSQPATRDGEDPKHLPSVPKNQTQALEQVKKPSPVEANGKAVVVTTPTLSKLDSVPVDARTTDSEASDKTPADLTAAVTHTANGKAGAVLEAPALAPALEATVGATASQQEAPSQQSNGVRAPNDVEKATVTLPDVKVSVLDASAVVSAEATQPGSPAEPTVATAADTDTAGIVTPPYSPVSLTAPSQALPTAKQPVDGIVTPLYSPANPISTPSTTTTPTAESDTVSSLTTTTSTTEPSKTSNQSDIPTPATDPLPKPSIYPNTTTPDLPTKTTTITTAASESDAAPKPTVTSPTASDTAQSPVSTTSPFSRPADQRPSPIQLFPTTDPNATPPSPASPVKGHEPEIISLSVKELFEQLRQQMFSKDSTSAALSPPAQPTPAPEGSMTRPAPVPRSVSMAATTVAPDTAMTSSGRLKTVNSQDSSAGKEVREVPIGPPPPGAVLRTRSKHDKRNTINAAVLLKSGTFRMQPLVDFVQYERLVKLRIEDGIDSTRKEDYLSDADFERVIGMNRDAFTALPKWRKDNIKKAKFLF